MHKVALLAFVSALLSFQESASQWTKTSGPEGGRASAMITTPASVLLGLEGGAVYRSTDHGTAWTSPTTEVNTIGGNISGFATSGTALFLSTTRNGVYRSTDDGVTWAVSSGGLTGNGLYVNAIVTKGGVGILATLGGPFRSTNNGSSWVLSSSGLPTDTTFGALLATANAVFLGSDAGAGVFVSTDDGASWARASTGLSGSGARVGSFAASGANVVAGTRQGAFRSTDNGAHWNLCSSGLANTSVSALYANGSDFFAGTYGAGVYRSTDGGVNWNAAGTIGNPNVRAFTAVGTDLLAGTYGYDGVYRSSNAGTTWTSAGKGVVGTGVFALAAHSGKTIVSTYDFVFASTNEGTVWSRSDSGLTSKTLYSLLSRTNDLLAGTTGAGVFRSTDGGISWSPANTGLNGNGGTVWDMAFDGANLFAATSSGVFRSTNDGGQWVQTTSGIADSATMRLIATNGVLCCGTRSSVYRSTDAGQNWSVAINGLPLYFRPTDFAVAGGDLFVSITGGVYRSSDYGVHWVSMNEGLPPNPDVQALATYDRAAPNGPTLFAGLDNGGVYVSPDTGTTWVDVGTGLTGAGKSVYSLLAAQGILYAGTPASGVWKRQLSQMVTSIAGGSRATSFVLDQNYPNPFNPSTTIRYELPKASLVRLSVYDILGREVRILVNERENAGSYRVTCDATGLASGVYFYRLHAGSFVKSLKLLLLR